VAGKQERVVAENNYWDTDYCFAMKQKGEALVLAEFADK
jgi:hypothetical protein